MINGAGASPLRLLGGSAETLLGCAIVLWLVVTSLRNGGATPIGVALAGAALVYTVARRGIRPVNPLDIFIALVLIAEGVRYAISPSWGERAFLLDIYVAVAAYALARMSLQTERDFVAWFCGLAITGAFFALMSLAVLWGSTHFLAGLTHANIATFRGELSTPFGLNTGDWSTVLLSFVCFPAALAWWAGSRWILACWAFLYVEMLLAAAVLATMSRGAFLGLLAFGLAFSAGFFAKALMRASQWITAVGPVVIGAATLLVVIGIGRGVVATIFMGATLSQALSVQARYSQYGRLWPIMHDHWLWGVGARGFPAAYLPASARGEHSGFSSAVFSLGAEIVVEHGVIGALLSLGLACVLGCQIRALFRRGGDPFFLGFGLFAASAMTGLLVRDIAYSSLLRQPTATLLVAVMFAVVSASSSAVLPAPKCAVPRRGGAVAFGSAALAAAVALAASAIGLLTWSAHNTEASLQHGLDALASHRPEKAVKILQRIVDLGPQSAYIVASLGLASAQCAGFTFQAETEGRTGRLDLTDSLTLYSRAVELNPFDDAFHLNLGWLYLGKSLPRLAEREFREAIRIDPTTAVSHVSLGMLLERLGLTDEAAKEYASAIADAPSLLDSQFFVELRERSPSRARSVIAATISQAQGELAHDPHDPFVQGRLGALYLATGHRASAKALLLAVTSGLPHLSRPWVYLGRLDLQEHLFSDAIRCFRLGVFLDPSDAQGWDALRLLYQSRHDVPESANAYHMALAAASFPASVHALRCSALYLVKQPLGDDLLPQGLLSYSTPRPAGYGH